MKIKDMKARVRDMRIIIEVYDACAIGQGRVIQHLNLPWRLEAGAWRDLYLARKLTWSHILANPDEHQYHDVRKAMKEALHHRDIVAGRLDDVYDTEGLEQIDSVIDKINNM